MVSPYPHKKYIYKIQKDLFITFGIITNINKQINKETDRHTPKHGGGYNVTQNQVFKTTISKQGSLNVVKEKDLRSKRVFPGYLPIGLEYIITRSH